MHNQNKILRVLQLISLLKTKPAKSIRHLSEVINSTQRTIYRYIDLLAELGFHIEKDNYNRFFIESNEKNNDLDFNMEEIQLLKQLVQTVGKDNKVFYNILKDDNSIIIKGFAFCTLPKKGELYIDVVCGTAIVVDGERVDVVDSGIVVVGTSNTVDDVVVVED
jgi:hypothetical protein